MAAAGVTQFVTQLNQGRSFDLGRAEGRGPLVEEPSCVICQHLAATVSEDSSMADWRDDEERADYDRILGQATGLLAQRGDEQAVALLVDVQSMEIVDTDEEISTERYWDAWGELYVSRVIYRRVAVFDVEEHLVERFAGDVLGRIAETLSYAAERNGEENVSYVKARTALPAVDGDWRQTYSSRQSLARPSNQARRETGLAANPVEDALTFGSAEELRVYKSLKRLQRSFPEEETIAIAPLAGVHMRAGNTWSPDVIVTGRGRAMIIEIDGPHHRGERRYVDDRNRDLQWQRCGVPVVRIAVEDLKEDEALDRRLREELLRHLSR